MDAPSSLPKPASALPRPMSKLPTLRPVSTIPSATNIPRSPSPQQSPIRQPLSALPSMPRQSMAMKPRPTPLPRSPSPEAKPQQSPVRQPLSGVSSMPRQSFSMKARPTSVYSPTKELPQPTHRRPLQPSSRPQSRHDSATSSFDGDYHNGQMRLKGQRHPSQQENNIELLASPPGSDASSETAGSGNNSPTSTIKRGPRASLSDRTLESISNIPASPGIDRRRSSFFNPQSPMAAPARQASHPPSAYGQNNISKLDFNAPRNGGFARPTSPLRRPGSSGLPTSPVRSSIATPQRRSVSSSLPKPGGPVSAIATPNKRASVLPAPALRATGLPTGLPGARTVARPTETSQTPASRQRPMSMMGLPSKNTPAARPRAASKPSTQPSTKPSNTPAKVSRPASGLSKPAPKQPPTTEAEAEAAPIDRSAKSSADFRAQIAKAKAAARAAANQKKQAETATPSYDFENSEDPFNQGPSEPDSLTKRIEGARRDGRLNIAAQGFKSIPDGVIRMYDSESMATSSLTWSETVDLTRLNAADNEIEQITDEMFPDATAEELGRGNQFGGLQNLDLHGNRLKMMPMGLRRLEMLTTLNLSRNKLDSSIFSIVTQISSLRDLQLAENELTGQVPENISALTNLETLNLSSNKLTSLPGSVRDLVNLHVMNLSSNRFDSLPIGSLFSLPTLKEVYVASNALTGAFFPMTVDINRSLIHLDLSNNSLASLSFGTELHLPAIQVLNVARNRLFGLPNISSWTNLTILLADENGLAALPDGLTSLKKLKTADFTRNSLRSVDPEIAKMPCLEMFGVAANPLREKKLLTLSTPQIKAEMMKKLENNGVGGGVGGGGGGEGRVGNAGGNTIIGIGASSATLQSSIFRDITPPRTP